VHERISRQGALCARGTRVIIDECHVIVAHPAGRTYFFTLNTYRRQVLLTQAEVLTALRSAHRVVRATRPFRVEAMVVLPDHLHAVGSLPSGDADYSTHLSLLKRHVSQTVRHLLLASQSASRHKRRELALWQRRFWGHQIRDAGDYARHVDHVHYNPVKHGLVAEVRDWPYSRFHRYVRLGLYPNDWAGTAVARTQGGYGELNE